MSATSNVTGSRLTEREVMERSIATSQSIIKANREGIKAVHLSDYFFINILIMLRELSEDCHNATDEEDLPTKKVIFGQLAVCSRDISIEYGLTLVEYEARKQAATDA